MASNTSNSASGTDSASATPLAAVSSSSTKPTKTLGKTRRRQQRLRPLRRIYSMVAAEMSPTENRGRIIWILAGNADRARGAGASDVDFVPKMFRKYRVTSQDK